MLSSLSLGPSLHSSSRSYPSTCFAVSSIFFTAGRSADSYVLGGNAAHLVGMWMYSGAMAHPSTLMGLDQIWLTSPPPASLVDASRDPAGSWKPPTVNAALHIAAEHRLERLLWCRAMATGPS